ncbi:L-glyceraldehyde 3-phosphate reductase [Paenibacillus sp. UNCCL117]|uniref:aldo/keto reductase n=1 Tax=unclassified Paenibacillus TaxID=185978 RepID=UPI00088E551B|nr:MULTISPECIES: aldo/keto reductase [unclassified Paenibacillus]SDD32110.1 L-glyceraldehyde 3-phosphate reductase [Paenibacillus sp. cl123]SFW39930.1 L-glyceraldehyde 3-phosphate reductase [Paenibacillus sp. UNCCL117]
MTYQAQESRYTGGMLYRRTGASGLKLSAISLGLWHNYGGHDAYENGRAMFRRAFDLGITHIDLANNYGPPPGSAEETFGRLLKADFAPYRDELVVATKAGYRMWPGPYGEWGSRKSMLASLDQSLKRMGLDYVDIFYSHRFDPNTPLEETMGALSHAVRQGKALYVGISNYNAEQTKEAVRILRALGTPCLIHQVHYSMFERKLEEGLQQVLEEEGVGSIAYSPLARGLLTDRYLERIPEDSRAAGASVFLRPEDITEAKVAKARLLNALAAERGQTLAQMAVVWALQQGRVTSALIGASRVSQIEDIAGALRNPDFSAEELARIETILAEG